MRNKIKSRPTSAWVSLYVGLCLTALIVCGCAQKSASADTPAQANENTEPVLEPVLAGVGAVLGASESETEETKRDKQVIDTVQNGAYEVVSSSFGFTFEYPPSKFSLNESDWGTLLYNTENDISIYTEVLPDDISEVSSCYGDMGFRSVTAPEGTEFSALEDEANGIRYYLSPAEVGTIVVRVSCPRNTSVLDREIDDILKSYGI